jgi:hypothetical protein
VEIFDREPQLWLDFLEYCDHPVLSYVLPMGDVVPESLIWWTFLCYFGFEQVRQVGIEFPPAQRYADYNLDWPHFSEAQQLSLLQMLVGFFKSYRDSDLGHEDFLGTFVSFFEKTPKLSPEWLQIARYLPSSRGLLERALELFQGGERTFSLIYIGSAGDWLDVGEAASILLILFDDPGLSTPNSTLVQTVRMIENYLECNADVPHHVALLAGVVGYLWPRFRYPRDQKDFYKSVLLKIGSVVNSKYRPSEGWWIGFGEALSQSWDQNDEFPDLTLDVPSSVRSEVERFRQGTT